MHLTRDEVSRLASLGCWLVHNPRSNEQNRVGYAAALGASPLVALGTDGFPSDMTVECQTGARLASANGESAEVVRERLEAGTRLAAERFGWAEQSVEVMRRADGGVDRLVVAGRVIVDRGTLITGDFDAIRADAATQAARLAARM